MFLNLQLWSRRPLGCRREGGGRKTALPGPTAPKGRGCHWGPVLVKERSEAYLNGILFGAILFLECFGRGASRVAPWFSVSQTRQRERSTRALVEHLSAALVASALATSALGGVGRDLKRRSRYAHVDRFARSPAFFGPSPFSRADQSVRGSAGIARLAGDCRTAGGPLVRGVIGSDRRRGDGLRQQAHIQ